MESCQLCWRTGRIALKPTRRITRRELKRDPLLETIYSLQKLYERNRRVVRVVVLGGAAVGMIVLILSGWRSSLRQSAEELFSRGMSRYNTGETGAARDDFETLMDEYDGTRSGQDALYYLGKIYLDSGDSSEAENSFRQYLKKGKSVFLRAASLESLGNLARSKGAYEEAARLFARASSLPTFPFNQQQNKIHAAECWLKAGDREKARILLLELESAENVHRIIQDQVDELFAHLTLAASQSSSTR